MYFVIRKTKGGEYWYRIVGDNHEPMAHSETMKSKASVESAIATIRREASAGTTVDMTHATDPTAEPGSY